MSKTEFEIINECFPPASLADMSDIKLAYILTLAHAKGLSETPDADHFSKVLEANYKKIKELKKG